MAPHPELLRRIVRHHARGWLADPNVTSVGVGYKQVGGERTDELAIQFTVREKLPEDQLEARGTRRLPEVIEFDQERVAADVVQRSFVPAYQVVAEADSDARRSRVDPVQPGVSIAHPLVSAGTAGVVVHDLEDGSLRILSNWHVLHGPAGAIGDTVVQPGPHDDNRTGRNALGTLVRSHLGAAGDAAICTVEGRGVTPELLGLDVAPEEIAEPELDDQVVKSGRTTGVTHGVVTRVDVMVSLDYGLENEVAVGGFEIGPDPRREQDRLSDGGDSGAAWLHKAGNGHPARILAGIHFGGNAPGEEEHALACLPRSVFTKLGVTLDAGRAAEAQERARAQAAEEARATGFDEEFLSSPITLPEVKDAADLVEVDGSTTIPYTHFSLAQSRSRRFARWVAWNIDGGNLRALSRTGLDFHLDPRLPEEAQAGADLYRGNDLDRGHIARRADLCWGEQAEQANRDSFFFTNIAPQMNDFNQSGRGGVWGELENAVFEDIEVESLRISVLGGPVFGEDDREYRGLRIPREFWKVICFVTSGELRARAFLMTQNLDRLETLDLGEFRTWQVELGTIEQRTGLRFDPALAAAGPSQAEALNGPRRLDRVADISW